MSDIPKFRIECIHRTTREEPDPIDRQAMNDAAGSGFMVFAAILLALVCLTAIAKFGG